MVIERKIVHSLTLNACLCLTPFRITKFALFLPLIPIVIGSRGDFVTFEAPKVTKSAVPQQKASLPHKPFRCKPGKTGAALILPGETCALRPGMAKTLMPCRHTARHCFAWFRAKLTAEVYFNVVPGCIWHRSRHSFAGVRFSRSERGANTRKS